MATCSSRSEAFTGFSSAAERGGSDARVARAAARLDLHEGIVDDPRAKGCKRWPERMWLLNEKTGELLPGRCKATNLCRYCQKLYTVETVEMLTLDALENAPVLWLVLTAREHLTRSQCRRLLELMRRTLKRRWPDVEWFVQVEFQRRGALHLNLLVKGVQADELVEFRAAATDRWCGLVDALPQGQWGDVVNDGLGVTRYIAKMLSHGLKQEQAPPLGWRGHRTSQTRGYLVRPASVMREEARASLREKRRLFRAIDKAAEIAGGTPTADLVEWVADNLRDIEAGTTWRLINREPGELRWSDTGRRMIPAGAAAGAEVAAGVAPHGAPGPVAAAATGLP